MSQIYPFDPANLQGNMTTNKVDDPNMRYSWGFKFKDPNCGPRFFLNSTCWFNP